MTTPLLPVRMVPGIVYSPVTQRARIQGTGLEVWEIVQAFESVDRDFSQLHDSFDWLRAEQLQSALRFAELNREFVSSRLAREEDVPRQIEELWQRKPHTKPPHLA
jgi:uncharacterized protein (DUF433 family)